jgi:hypothetical protein
MPSFQGPPDPRRYQLSLKLEFLCCRGQDEATLHDCWLHIKERRGLYAPGKQADLPPWEVAKTTLLPSK